MNLRSSQRPNLKAISGSVPTDFESKFFVKRDGRHILRIDSGDHDVLLQACRLLQQGLHERASYAAAPVIGAHVHAVLDAVTIAGPGAELAEGAESDDPRGSTAASTGKPAVRFASNQASRFSSVTSTSEKTAVELRMTSL